MRMIEFAVNTDVKLGLGGPDHARGLITRRLSSSNLAPP